MRTKSIGEILSEERLAHRVSLEFLSGKSKINLNFLEALEANRYQDLPSAIYIKSFIKTYAKIFGLDHQPLFAMLRRDYQEDEKGRLIKRQDDEEGQRHRSWKPADLLVFVSVAVFITLISFIAFKWQQFNKAPQLKIFSPQEMENSHGNVPISGQTDPDAIVEVNSQAITIQRDGSFSYELILPREGVNTISIKATNQKGKSTLTQRSVNIIH